jgi:cellulose synthase/poly-beta-1,6-N-acetylglucosamine synthase-like glycosyltransferase
MDGAISTRDLARGLDLQGQMDAPLGEILIDEGVITRPEMLQALARQYNAQLVDLDATPPALRLAQKIPAALCLRHRVVPWLQVDDVLLVATATPAGFDAFKAEMALLGLQILPVIADETAIIRQLERLFGPQLALEAATRLPPWQSCRSWQMKPMQRRLWAWGILALLGIATALAPLWVLTVLILWAFVTLVMSSVLKGAAFYSQMRHRARVSPDPLPAIPTPFAMPQISMLVPLLKEKEIANALVKRLERLTYPKPLLDIVLVLEAGDGVTKETLARTELPDWMRVIEVPQAHNLMTKPRALNYALDFCRGQIVGVWDAEDAPEPGQLEKVARRFNDAPGNVACLQGVLDYYNSRTNWVSRCFAIEYATWWRMILPGVARLGLVIPLGGTTLFFRRKILEELCGWDAHNVTEDADLGVRLARQGYVTELIDTTTYEEANFRAWPWVKQRSRWLKGFLITWCVHMRHPRRMIRDLGVLRFLGVQTLLFATFSQFLLAPLLWTFWLSMFGMPHPIAVTLGTPVMWGMIAVFAVSELMCLIMAMVAVSGPAHRHLMWWCLTLPAYFPMATLAAFKGLHEFVVKPFYWDKTMHGVPAEAKAKPPKHPLLVLQHPVSDAH